jgi:hypothetical protein
MNPASIKPDGLAWIIRSGCVNQITIKDVCTSDGRRYLPDIDGDDCYVRYDRRRGEWLKHDKLFETEREAKVELARRLREEAAALIRQAFQLECEADTRYVGRNQLDTYAERNY